MQRLTASVHEEATTWVFNKLLTYRVEGGADAEPSPPSYLDTTSRANTRRHVRMIFHSCLQFVVAGKVPERSEGDLDFGHLNADILSYISENPRCRQCLSNTVFQAAKVVSDGQWNALHDQLRDHNAANIRQ
jgi:hypothetical protein